MKEQQIEQENIKETTQAKQNKNQGETLNYIALDAPTHTRIKTLEDIIERMKTQKAEDDNTMHILQNDLIKANEFVRKGN